MKISLKAIKSMSTIVMQCIKYCMRSELETNHLIFLNTESYFFKDKNDLKIFKQGFKLSLSTFSQKAFRFKLIFNYVII